MVNKNLPVEFEEKICAIPECKKQCTSRGRNSLGDISRCRFCRFHQIGIGKKERQEWSKLNPSPESIKKIKP